MNTKHHFELYEQLEDLEDLPSIRNVPTEQIRNPHHNRKRTQPASPDELFTDAERENQLDFSYHAAKHEKEWLINSLEDFYHQQWFDDVLRLIKGGGKEASVYQCQANQTTPGRYLAAKVYRPRKFRQLRNDSLYREGRLHLDDEGHEIRDDRALHAIDKRTNFGMRLMHTSWIEHEFQTMSRLHQAGADIPQPFVSGNNAILMAYIGWDDVAAPTLNTVGLSPQEAQMIFERVLHNIELMLSHHRVHGDLSAYNILYFEGEIFLIDFPQAIDPDVNSNAYAIFCRDIRRICEYFQHQGVKRNAQILADDLWQKHGYAFPPIIDPRWMMNEYD
jgi:RIO kinase 1